MIQKIKADERDSIFAEFVQRKGEITSGTWSPTLGEAIAMAYVPTALAHIGNVLEVEIRGKNHPATVVKRPFYRRASFN